MWGVRVCLDECCIYICIDDVKRLIWQSSSNTLTSSGVNSIDCYAVRCIVIALIHTIIVNFDSIFGWFMSLVIQVIQYSNIVNYSLLVLNCWYFDIIYGYFRLLYMNTNDRIHGKIQTQTYTHTDRSIQESQRVQRQTYKMVFLKKHS